MLLLVNDRCRRKASVVMAAVIFFVFPSGVKAQDVQGKKIVLSTCVDCHGAEDGSLSGNRIMDAPKFLGKIIAPSLMKNGVLGKWSEEDFKRFLRTGNRPDKSKKRAYMPQFPNVSDKDVHSIFSYLSALRSTSESGSNELKRTKLNFAARVVSNLLTKDYGERAIVEHPDTANGVVWGKYLVNDVLHCFACHSSSPAKINYLEPNLSKGYLQGGFTFKDLDGRKIKAPAIAFLNNKKLPYSESEFLALMSLGKKRNGDVVRHPMKPYGQLSQAEMKAVYSYLITIPSKK